MSYGYATEITENCAKAVGIGLPVSWKHSAMVCQTLRQMNVQKAKQLLEDVIAMKRPIEYTKHNKGLAHKAGIGAGRYPVKTCKHILTILKSAEANAQFKGLSTGNLFIKNILAQRGPGTQRFGRNRNNAKRTHIELVVEQRKAEAKKE